MDQQNLEYLRTTKRLDPRQAHWTLFFSQLNFALSYHPGSKNVKPDSLSHIYSTSQDTSKPVTIQPPGNLVAVTQFEVVNSVKDALQGCPTPVDTPSNQLLVPEGVHPKGPGMGPFLTTCLPFRSPPHLGTPPTSVLAARSHVRDFGTGKRPLTKDLRGFSNPSQCPANPREAGHMHWIL